MPGDYDPPSDFSTAGSLPGPQKLTTDPSPDCVETTQTEQPTEQPTEKTGPSPAQLAAMEAELQRKLELADWVEREFGTNPVATLLQLRDAAEASARSQLHPDTHALRGLKGVVDRARDTLRQKLSDKAKVALLRDILGA